MTLDSELINVAIALGTGLLLGTTKLRVCSRWLLELRLNEEREHLGMVVMEVFVVFCVVLVVALTGHIKGEDWGVFGLGTALPWWIRGIFMMKKEMKTLREIADLKEEIGQLRETLKTHWHSPTSETSANGGDGVISALAENQDALPP